MRDLKWYLPSNCTQWHVAVVRMRKALGTACGMLIADVPRELRHDPEQDDSCQVCWEAFEKWREQCSAQSSSGQSGSRSGGGSSDNSPKPPQW